MNTLYSVIKEKFIINTLEKIDNEIISESIKASVIKDLANQLLDQRNKEKKEKENDRWKSIYNELFKQIFGNKPIPWDKINDSDIQTIPAETWDINKTKTANQKLIRSIIKGDKDGIVICRDPETKQFEYVVFTFGSVIVLKPSYSKTAGDSIEGYRNRYTQTEKIELFNNKILYFIDQSKFKDQINNLTKERWQSKVGMVNMDPDSLRKIAQENVERYKKLLTQKKAKNQNNDALLDEANDIIKRISEITIQVAKDPGAYADILSKISTLTKYVYDERRYTPGRTPRQQGYYSGYNGLIPMIAKYIEAIKDSSQGYSWGSEKMDSTIKTIKDTMSKCKTLLQETEELL